MNAIIPNSNGNILLRCAINFCDLSFQSRMTRRKLIQIRIPAYIPSVLAMTTKPRYEVYPQDPSDGYRTNISHQVSLADVEMGTRGASVCSRVTTSYQTIRLFKLYTREQFFMWYGSHIKFLYGVIIQLQMKSFPI